MLSGIVFIVIIIFLALFVFFSQYQSMIELKEIIKNSMFIQKLRKPISIFVQPPPDPGKIEPKENEQIDYHFSIHSPGDYLKLFNSDNCTNELPPSNFRASKSNLIFRPYEHINKQTLNTDEPKPEKNEKEKLQKKQNANEEEDTNESEKEKYFPIRHLHISKVKLTIPDLPVKDSAPKEIVKKKPNLLNLNIKDGLNFSKNKTNIKSNPFRDLKIDKNDPNYRRPFRPISRDMRQLGKSSGFHNPNKK